MPPIGSRKCEIHFGKRSSLITGQKTVLKHPAVVQTVHPIMDALMSGSISIGNRKGGFLSSAS